MKHWNLNSQVVYILFRFLSVGIEEKNFEFHRSALETSTFVYNQFLWKVWILLQNPLKLYAVRVCWALAADIKHFFLPWNFFYPEMLKSTRNSVSGFHALLTRTCVWLTRAILRIRVEFFFSSIWILNVNYLGVSHVHLQVLFSHLCLYHFLRRTLLKMQTQIIMLPLMTTVFWICLSTSPAASKFKFGTPIQLRPWLFVKLVSFDV